MDGRPLLGFSVETEGSEAGDILIEVGDSSDRNALASGRNGAYLGDMSNAGQSPKPDHKEERSDYHSALSKRARMFGRAVADSAADDLGNALCAALHDLLGWPYKVGSKYSFDAAARTSRFAAVVYVERNDEPPTDADAVPADNTAAVIDACAELDLARFRDAYTRIGVAKSLAKSPAPILDEAPVTTNTLGIIFAQHSALPIEACADELERLNGVTPSALWPDMIAVASVGVINYGVQFPGESGIAADHLPAAPGAAKGKPPPMYIVITVRPISKFAFNKMAAFLIGHLAFFSPGAQLPNYQHLLEGMPDFGITKGGFQFNLAGELVPVPRQFYNDRYMPPPPLRIEDSGGDLMATIQLLPWQDGGVLLMQGKRVPLEGMMVFLDAAARTTLAVFRRPNDLQLSYVLPISPQQFGAFLQRFQNQSNMRVRPSQAKWLVQKLADEGASSLFMARLFMGILRMRDVAYPDTAKRDAFDKTYEAVSAAVVSARDTAKEIETLWLAHAERVTSGVDVRRTAYTLDIGDGIDRDLRRLTENFLVAAARALKHGLQQLAGELGINLGFWFQQQPAFEKGVAALALNDPTLAAYLQAARAAWSETLVLRRNSIEHDGWCLPKTTYRDEAGVVTPIEPDIDGVPFRAFVSSMLDRLSCAIEEITVHLLRARMPPQIGVHEIAIDDRPAEAPERFRITPLVGGEQLWELRYSAARLEEK